jgi:hypothetical protein
MGNCMGHRVRPSRSRIICTPRTEIRTHAIHLVDKGDTRHVVLVGLTPYGLGLWLDAAYRTENSNRSVQYAQ